MNAATTRDGVPGASDASMASIEGAVMPEQSGAWPPVRILPMNVVDLDAVAQLELTLYSHPWTRTNFADSLKAGYAGWVLTPEESSIPLLGYCVLMHAVDELHLLNLSVSQPYQGRGYGRILIDQVRATGREMRATCVILEVRPSNQRALDLYARYGFRQIGVRRGYYPRGDIDVTLPEDALVMQLDL